MHQGDSLVQRKTKRCILYDASTIMREKITPAHPDCNVGILVFWIYRRSTVIAVPDQRFGMT